MLIELAKDERIDWFRVITDLERAGYPHNAIAVYVGVGKRTVGGWKQGASPKTEDGLRLIGLWSLVTKNGRESAPRVKRHSFRAY